MTGANSAGIKDKVEERAGLRYSACAFGTGRSLYTDGNARDLRDTPGARKGRVRGLVETISTVRVHLTLNAFTLPAGGGDLRLKFTSSKGGEA